MSKSKLQEARARARTAVVAAAAFACLLQCAYHYPITALWLQVQDGEYAYKLASLRAQLAVKKPTEAGVVMIGSSLTGWGLDPASMTRIAPGTPEGPVVFNFGMNSCGPVAQSVFLKRLFDSGVKPDLVLLEMQAWFVIEGHNQVASEHFLQIPRLWPREVLPLLRYDRKPAELLFSWFRELWAPWYYNRHNIQNVFWPSWVPKATRINVWDITDRHGWEGKLTTFSAPLPPEQAEAGAVYHMRTLMDQPFDQNTHVAVREMIAECRRRGVAVLIVRVPEHSSVVGRAPRAWLDKIELFFTNLIADTRVEVIDGRAWVQDAGFTDGSHLGRAGAKEFSVRLENDLLISFCHQIRQMRRGAHGEQR